MTGHGDQRPSHPDTRADGTYQRDQHYLTTRITADGRDGFPVEAGRYRLVAARACPWANRSIIVRRLLGLECVLSQGLCAPVHDERSWTFDLDPGGKDPVLGIHRLREAYLARDPDYPRGITVPAIVEVATGEVVTNDFAQITLDLSTEWSAFHRPGAPDLYPERLRDQIDEINAVVFTDVNNGVYRAGRASTQDAYETAYHRLFARLDDLSDRLRGQRYLVGDTITEADVRLFTTLARFDAVYHSHFKANRSKLTEMPVLWAYARDLFQTPGFGDTIDFTQIKQHYYRTQPELNPSGIVPVGPDTDGWWTPHHRDELGGRPFGAGTPPEPPSQAERVTVSRQPMAAVIRSPTAADFEGWQRLWNGYLDFYEQPLPAEVSAHTWRRILDDDSALIGRLAERDGDVVGFTVSVLHDGTWTTRPILYLEDLFVDPERRGAGLGRDLLNDVVHQAHARGCSSLYWHTRADNAAARRLYDRFVAADDFVRYRMML